MSFLVLITVLSFLAYIPQHFSRYRSDRRMAMRHGIAGGFLFTGIDHFLNVQTRYVPMIPEALTDYASSLVYITGAAEIAGAVGLVIPISVYRHLGLPNLRRAAGVGLAVLLAFLVIANINVALKGTGVVGLPFGSWYFWLRPAIQPVFIAWVLYVSKNASEKDPATRPDASTPGTDNRFHDGRVAPPAKES